MKIILLVLAAALAPAQETAGSIVARVVDPSGAVVAGAEVTALHTPTGAVRRARTASDGNAVFPNLPVGPYTLAAAHKGFKQTVEQGLELHVSEKLGAELKLEVGDSAQQVTVTATPDEVQSESSEQGALISGEQVRELQLNGRSFMTLLELVPGVASDMGDRADPNSSPAVSINGARSSASSFNIDGGTNSDVIVGSSSLNTFTSVETIAEFNVITSTFSAEYGRGGFSQVNVVTKSGTKQLHGSLFHYLRNDAFDARDFLSHQVLPLKLNNFGYTLGGPLVIGCYNRQRNRTFFFFAQEFNRIVTRGEAVNTTVPTALEHQGDFSASAGNLIDPTTGSAFPGKVIPPSRIDANSAKLIALFPPPNFVGPGQINYTSAAAARQNWREEMIRIDHNFARGLRVYGRYAQDSAFVRNPYGGSSIASVTTRFPGVAETQAGRPGKNLVLNASHSVRGTLLHQFSFTFARRYFDMQTANTGTTRKALGLTLPELFPENDSDIPPVVSMTNYAGLNIPRRGHKELFNTEYMDNWTKLAGRHTLKFGGIYSHGGNLEQPFSPNTSGTFSFSTNNSRNPVGNFLLLLPLTYSEAERTVWSDARFGMLEAYAQDDWRVSRRLTVNAGLRWSNYHNPYDLADKMSNFSAGLWRAAAAPQVLGTNGTLVAGTGEALNGIVIAGKNSAYGRRVANSNLNLLGPRFGFAWAPGSRRWALRGGWGMFYTRPLIGTFINNTFDNPPFSRTVTLNNPQIATAISGTEAALNPPTLTALGDPLKAPTVHQWSFGPQMQVGRGMTLSLSYVGTRGLRLQRPLNLNNPPPGLAAALGKHYNSLRPYLGWGGITERQTSGGMIYHSLQAAFNRRLAKNVTGGIAYTFAKTIDNGSSERGGSDIPPDSSNARAERARADYDRAHVFTANFIYVLPGKTKRWYGGWQLSGITRLWSGRPLDVTMSTDVAGIGSAQNQRPDVLTATAGPRKVEQWFNILAFARPRTGTFGNLGRNALAGPGTNKWDATVSKTFTLPEAWRLQFRAEFFNAFNHPSFSTVGTSVNTVTTGLNPQINNFGVVTGTRDARVIQLALKLSF